MTLLVMILVLGGIVPGCGGDSEHNPRFSEESDGERPSDSLAELSPDSQEEPAALAPTVVAVVNGEEISAAELAERLHTILATSEESDPPDEYTLTRQKEIALKELIEQRLIRQHAKTQGVTVEEEEFQQFVARVQEEYQGADIQEIVKEQGILYQDWERAQRERLLQDKLVDLDMASMITVPREEIQQYYERNKEKYDHPAQIRASQILTYDEDVAERALEEIRNGAEFSAVARKYSESPDASSGGDLGFFARGVMPPEFDGVIFSLQPGEVSQITQTPYGYQLFTLTGERAAHRVSFEEAQSQIEHKLKQEKRMLATDLWMAELQSAAKILLNHNSIKHVTIIGEDR